VGRVVGLKKEDMSQHETRIIGVMGEVCVNGVVGGIDSCDELLQRVTGE
jgi:hypothetical protein